MSFVLFNRYRGKIGAFYNRSSKCTFVRSRYEFDILISLLLRIFLCLVSFILIFVKALKNFTGSLLKVSIISLHLLISFSLLTHSFPVHPFSTP